MNHPGTQQAARAEFDALTDDERQQLLATVVPDAFGPLAEAIKRMTHACRVLGFDPDSLDPNHVALTAAALIGRTS